MSSAPEGMFGVLIQLGLPALFGLYLTPKSVGNAEITFRGIDLSKFTGTPICASLPNGIYGQTTPLSSSARTIMFDSSTSNILFPTNTTNAIYAIISPDIKPNPHEPGAYEIPCNLISSMPAQIDIKFTSQQGVHFSLTIPSQGLNVGPFASDPTTCQTLINALDGTNLVGGLVWDVGAHRLGFAAAER